MLGFFLFHSVSVCPYPSLFSAAGGCRPDLRPITLNS
jgi:hypothetical protein